jgi:hypothetical protein
MITVDLDSLRKTAEWALQPLEWMARYGLLDIVFGVGVITVILNYLRSKVASDLKGVSITWDVQPAAAGNGSHCVEVRVLNMSSHPLVVSDPCVCFDRQRLQFKFLALGTWLPREELRCTPLRVDRNAPQDAAGFLQLSAAGRRVDVAIPHGETAAFSIRVDSNEVDLRMRFKQHGLGKFRIQTFHRGQTNELIRWL